MPTENLRAYLARPQFSKLETKRLKDHRIPCMQHHIYCFSAFGGSVDRNVLRESTEARKSLNRPNGVLGCSRRLLSFISLSSRCLHSIISRSLGIGVSVIWPIIFLLLIAPLRYYTNRPSGPTSCCAVQGNYMSPETLVLKLHHSTSKFS